MGERTGRLALRLDGRREALIRQAAAVSGKTVTDFLLDSATAAAEDALLDQRFFMMEDAAFDRFAAALDEEPRVLPRLRSFLDGT